MKHTILLELFMKFINVSDLACCFRLKFSNQQDARTVQVSVDEKLGKFFLCAESLNYLSSKPKSEQQDRV